MYLKYSLRRCPGVAGHGHHDLLKDGFHVPSLLCPVPDDKWTSPKVCTQKLLIRVGHVSNVTYSVLSLQRLLRGHSPKSQVTFQT